MPENELTSNGGNETTIPSIHPDGWTTGTEPITDKQAAELSGLSQADATVIPEDLSAAGAKIQIDALKKEQEDK